MEEFHFRLKCQIRIEKETRLKETPVIKVVQMEAGKPPLRKRYGRGRTLRS